jgi:hypothetical protein
VKYARAELCWVPAEAGGRSQVPASPYTTVATFVKADAATNRQWSLVCTFDELGEDCTVARVHFLFKNAPHHLLRPGAAFALHEGKKVVAHGAVEGILAEESVSERRG